MSIRPISKLEGIATSFSVIAALGFALSTAIYYPISIVDIMSKHYAERYYACKYPIQTEHTENN